MTTEIVKTTGSGAAVIGYTPAVKDYRKVGTTQCGNRTEIVYEKNGSLFFLDNKTGELKKFSETPKEMEEIGFWGKYEDWLDRKFGRIAEIDHSKVGADDGKVGAGRAFKILGQSIVKNFIKEPLKHPIAAAVLGTAAWLCPPVGTALCITGAIVGLCKLGKGLVNLIDAKKDEDAINAWEDTWTGGLTLGISAWGYKKSANKVAQLREQKQAIINEGDVSLARAHYIGGRSPANLEALRQAEYTAMQKHAINPATKGSWIEPFRGETGNFFNTKNTSTSTSNPAGVKEYFSRLWLAMKDNTQFHFRSKINYNLQNIKNSLLDATYTPTPPTVGGPVPPPSTSCPSWLVTTGKLALSPIIRQNYITPAYAFANLFPISSDLEEDVNEETVTEEQENLAQETRDKEKQKQETVQNAKI